MPWPYPIILTIIQTLKFTLTLILTLTQDNFDVMSMSSLDMVAKFLPMYEEQSSKICQGLNEVKEHHLAVEKQMKEVAEEINSTDPTKDGIVSR